MEKEDWEKEFDKFYCAYNISYATEESTAIFRLADQTKKALKQFIRKTIREAKNG